MFLLVYWVNQINFTRSKIKYAADIIFYNMNTSKTDFQHIDAPQ